MAITAVASRDELIDLIDELGVHSEGEEVDDLEDENVCLNEGEKNLQEVYDALLEDCGKYAKVAKNTVRKMKKIEEEYKSMLKEELLNAYSKIKFLELEIIQANVKVKHISTKKLDNVLSSQKPSNDKTSLGYTGEGSISSRGPTKEVKFVSAKNVEKSTVEKPEFKTLVVAKRTVGAKPKEKRKVITQKSKGTSIEAFLSSLWRMMAHKAKLLQASGTQEGYFFVWPRQLKKNAKWEFKLKEKMRENSLEMLWRC